MKLWAIARYDLGLTFEEFEELTPEMFNSLCERRNIKFKHERFAAGMVAAAVYNVNRASTESPVLTAFDFVREEAESAEKAEHDKIIGTIRQLVGQMPSDTPREKLLHVRDTVVGSLRAQGRKDAEALWLEAWPSLS